MHNNAFKDICNTIPNKNIIVIGDIMLDHYVYGSVDRISPESPVPVLAKTREDMTLGGAGNSFANLIGLEINASIISVIGQDQYGEKIKSLLQAKSVNSEHLIIDPARPTSLKTRFLAGHQQLLRTDHEIKTPISAQIEEKIISHFQALLPTSHAVVLSDYGKGVLTKRVLSEIITAANEKKIPVIVDPKGADYSIYQGAYAVTPNSKELSEATKNKPTKSDPEVITAARELINDHNINAVIATRSGDGISIIKQNAEDVTHIRPQHKVEVFDVSGAGDAVIATIAAAIAAGSSLDHAAHLANIAGHIAVTKIGTTPIRLTEIKNALAEGAINNCNNKRQAPLLTAEQAIEEIKRWHAKGQKVGFTNGCFDIVHAGHVTYLNETHEHCDRLILALNSDSSVKVLKGETRPIHDEQARATVIGGLSSVDMVILFGATKHDDDNTACALLDQLKPDVYFKGGDYTIDQIPEAPTVLDNGGEVKVLQVVEGYSTTKAIEKSKSA